MGAVGFYALYAITCDVVGDFAAGCYWIYQQM